MKWIVIILYIIGGFSALAAYGATEKRQKRTYWMVAIGIWIITFVLGNTILND